MSSGPNDIFVAQFSGLDGSPAGSWPVGRAASTDHIKLDVCTVKLRNPDDLREAVSGADLKIVQLAPGSFDGQLMRAQVGELSVSAGDFGPDIRARGVMNQQLVTVGMMLQSSGEVSQWHYDVVPGDIIVFPKSVEQEGRYTGRSCYATITLSEEALAACAAGEPALQEPNFWTRIDRFRPSPSLRAFIRREVAQKISLLSSGTVPTSEAGIRCFQQSLVEAFIAGIVDAVSDERDDRPCRDARLVRDVEDYLDSVEVDQPVHISELCSHFTVSRRTLHRAFQQALGMGPLTYLRLTRLSAVRHALVAAEPTNVSVTQAALDYGFTDLGRFAATYKKMFGEVPSQTRRKAMGVPGLRA
ncbi:MAG: helix-turn-helix domain-containing protein [Mesorhizobium sp.]